MKRVTIHGPFVLLAITSLGALLGSGISGAQEVGSDTGSRLEEITVTATRRSEKLQDVPMSITAISELQISRQGLDSVQDFSLVTPGLDYSEIGFAQRNGVNMTIRGIANSRLLSSQADTTAALTTGFYVDDVAMAPVDANLFDVNRIEVLKGPQGTLFGQASMGGTVRIILNKPDHDGVHGSVQASASLTDGESSNSGDAMINVPLINDILAVRAVLSFRNNGGWIDHRPGNLDPSVLGGVPTHSQSGVVSHANSGETKAARLSVLYTPNEQLSITPVLFWQKRELAHDNFYERIVNDNLQTELLQQRFIPEARKEEFTVASATIEYDFGAVQFTSITTFAQRLFNGDQDATTSLAASFGLNMDGSIPSANGFHMDYTTESVSQEFRLNGIRDISDNASINWVLGGVFIREEMENHWLWDAPEWNANADNGNEISNPEGLFILAHDNAEYENTSFFADVTLNFGKFGVSAGVRGFDQSLISDRTIGGSAFGDVFQVDPTATAGEDGTTFRAALTFDLSDTNRLYASISDGFRLGGPGLGGTLDIPACQDALNQIGLSGDPGDFDSDKVESVEVGIKTSFADGKTQVNAAIFKTDWTDLQQTVGLFNYNPGCTSLITTNIGAAESSGIEIAVDTLIGENLIIGGTASFVDVSITDAPVGIPISVGDPIGGVPEMTVSAYLEHSKELSHGLDGNFRLSWSYRDDMLDLLYVDQNDPYTQLDSYNMVNMSYQVKTPNNWNYLLYAENLLDEVGELGGNAQFGESFVNRVQIIRPLTVGFRIGYDFE